MDDKQTSTQVGLSDDELARHRTVFAADALKDHVVVISGGAGGIGRAIALASRTRSPRAPAWLIERPGRKPTLIGALLGAAIACYFYGGATSQTQLIVAGLCMQFCAFGMWSALYAYAPELYPTHVRARGTGFASAVGRIDARLTLLVTREISS
ncbi:MFS transporter [Bradyrhizobium cenepequi]